MRSVSNKGRPWHERPPLAPFGRPSTSVNKTNDRKAIVHSLRTMSEKDALTDTLELDLTLTLKRLADRLPLCNQELKAAEVCGRKTPGLACLASLFALLKAGKPKVIKSYTALSVILTRFDKGERLTAMP